MKRHAALQDLSRDHHSTLALAQKIIRAVGANDETAVLALTKKVKDFEGELKAHFEKEECSVFRLLSENHPEYPLIGQEYLDEHKVLLRYSRQVILAPSLANLEAFAILLRDHTRKEERILFPLVEECFSEAELLSIDEE